LFVAQIYEQHMTPFKRKPSITDQVTTTTTVVHSTLLGFDQLPNSAFIRESQLVQSPKRPGNAAPLPFSAPTLWRMVKAGTFPKPTKLSSRVTAWRVADIRDWMSAQTSA